VTTYDVLFKVPIISAPSFDGKRDLSQIFQHEIDVTIDALARDFGVSCHLLDPTAREDWIDTVLTRSGLPLRPPQIDLFRPRGADGDAEE
jgi:hypothetical protein